MPVRTLRRRIKSARTKLREKRIAFAAAVPEVGFIPVSQVRRIFHLSQKDAAIAASDAKESVRDKGKTKSYQRLKEIDALVETLKFTEKEYPGLLVSIVTVGKVAYEAKKHKITRARIYQIHRSLARFAELSDKPAVAVAKMTAVGKLPQTMSEAVKSKVSLPKELVPRYNRVAVSA
mgnify:CR=1 FL=1